jgi:hypothetical protein
MRLADASRQQNLMSRRTAIYLGTAALLLVLGRLLSTKPEAPHTAPTPSSEGGGAVPTTDEVLTTSGPHLRRPPSSIATFGVLSDRSEAELETVIDRAAVAGSIVGRLCGDDDACNAVRLTLRDESATTLQVTSAADWSVGPINLDASGVRPSGATPLGSVDGSALRASLARHSHVVVVNVATSTSPRQLAIRAAIAAAAAIAQKIDGLVHDPLLSRLETPREFATHAITAPLGQPAFRRDRIELLYEPKEEGIVRLLTAGLSRWGAPDVEAARVPVAVEERVAEIVLAVAEGMTNAPEAVPFMLSRDDLGRARGSDYPEDGGFPPLTKVAVDVVSVRPEAGDPNDFMARIEPPAGDGPIGYVDLAERFFGPLLAPSSEVMARRRADAQRRLASALARWSSPRAGGQLLVQLPFPIPGDAGVESMWVQVTRYDARTVTGRLIDEPLGATEVSRGDEVTKPREEVEDLRAP